MSKIERYDGNVKAFGSSALDVERTVFGDESTQSDTLDANITDNFLRGWGVLSTGSKPPKQYFNGLAFAISQLIAYLHQMGVAEWNTSQEYYKGGVCTHDSSLWLALADNTGSEPTSSNTNWDKLRTSSSSDFQKL